MHAHWAPVPRRMLAPLGAMLAISLVAGYLVTRGPAQAPESLVGGSSAPAPAATGGATAAGARAAEEGRPDVSQRPVSAAVQKGRPPAKVAPKASALYRFLLLQPDRATPIRWNPCRPVHYRIALNRLAPAGEIAQVRAVFDTVGAALGGVTFVYDGPTAVVPDTVDDAARADTDIVVAFALPGVGATRSTLLSGWEAGRGGFAAAGTAGADGVLVEHPTHGSVVVDADKWDLMTRHDRTILYLHEIGHVVGLDHPADGHQIMSSGAYDLPLRYQPGDLTGLAQLGRRAGCTG